MHDGNDHKAPVHANKSAGLRCSAAAGQQHQQSANVTWHGAMQIYQQSKHHWSRQAHAHSHPVEGILGAIGNTPLIRINSLSEETGCEVIDFTDHSGHSTSLKHYTLYAWR